MPKRGGAKVSGCGGELIAPQFGARKTRHAGIGIIVGIVVLVAASPASAYRPFDGTDAAVADKGEVEIEFQPAGELHANSRSTFAGPYTVVNYGFADRWELVLQGAPMAPPADVGPIQVPNGVFLKYVIQEGVLQEKSGPSVATEFGPLLPDVGGRGVGFEWAFIVSQRWDWGTIHLNIEPELTPDQHGEFVVDAIIEGPHDWKVRPVAEFYSDTVLQTQTFSALVGAIWQVNDKLAFDVAARYALVDERPVPELRAGVTFAFPLNFAGATGGESSKGAAGKR